MSEPVAQRKRLTPRRIAIAALLSAGVAIAIGFWSSNTGQASECPAQPEAAAKIDAAAVGQLAALNGTGTGRGYSDMSFTDADGNPRTLKDFAGKALLVNFWASWCIPCRAEMPALNELGESQNDDKFMVLPINLDLGAGGLEKAKAFLDEGNWPHLPLYADSTFESFKNLQASAVALGLPSTLLIDPNGCELAVLQGPAEWHTQDGINVIKALKSL